MRWALLGMALLLAVAGLLYRGGVAFLSTLSNATASQAVEGSGTVAATAAQVPAPTLPDRGPEADRPFAPEMPRAEPSLTPHPGVPSNPVDSSPIASEQRSFKSRRALETIDPREFLRQGTLPK